MNGAGCIILSHNTGRLMLGLRSSKVSDPHTWSLWGGKIEQKEVAKQTVLRELYEEAGYKGQGILIKINQIQSVQGTYHTFLYLVQKEFEPTLNWEHSDHLWFSVREWPTPLNTIAKQVKIAPTFIKMMKRFV